MANFYKRSTNGNTTVTTKLGIGTPTFSNRITPRGSAVCVTNVYKNRKMYVRTTEHIGGYTRVTTKRAGGTKIRKFRKTRRGDVSPLFLIPTVIILFLFAAMLN